eukprot:TRINITY_DN18819_c1_g1_i1.p1 TRINITY_DN18819_c1_g1~~TRINITY_DN18819_c1_g1_i1.p1  ORF type:complete len:141 (+),score=21.35 TRINITY_DN18819_c1_g1_i1:45-467(+)
MDDVVRRLEIVEAALTDLQATQATARTESAVTKLDLQTFGTKSQTKLVTLAPQASETRAQVNLVTPGPQHQHQHRETMFDMVQCHLIEHGDDEPRSAPHIDDITKKVGLEISDFSGDLYPKAFVDWLNSLDDYFALYQHE